MPAARSVCQFAIMFSPFLVANAITTFGLIQLDHNQSSVVITPYDNTYVSIVSNEWTRIETSSVTVLNPSNGGLVFRDNVMYVYGHPKIEEYNITLGEDVNITGYAFDYYHARLEKEEDKAEEYPNGLVYSGIMCHNNKTTSYNFTNLRTGDLIPTFSKNQSISILFDDGTIHFHNAKDDITIYVNDGMLVMYEGYFYKTTWRVNTTKGTLRIDAGKEFLACRIPDFEFHRMYNTTAELIQLPPSINWSDGDESHCFTNITQEASVHSVYNGFARAFEVRERDRQSTIFTDSGKAYHVHDDVAIYKQTDMLFIYGNRSGDLLNRLYVIPNVSNFTFVGPHSYCRQYGPFDLKHNTSIVTDHRYFWVKACGSQGSYSVLIHRNSSFITMGLFNPTYLIWHPTRSSDFSCSMYAEIPPHTQLSALSINYGYGVSLVMVPTLSSEELEAKWRAEDARRHTSTSTTTPTPTLDEPPSKIPPSAIFILVWSGVICAGLFIVGVLICYQIHRRSRDVWSTLEAAEDLTPVGREVLDMHRENEQQDAIAQVY